MYTLYQFCKLMHLTSDLMWEDFSYYDASEILFGSKICSRPFCRPFWNVEHRMHRTNPILFVEDLSFSIFPHDGQTLHLPLVWWNKVTCDIWPGCYAAIKWPFVLCWTKTGEDIASMICIGIPVILSAFNQGRALKFELYIHSRFISHSPTCWGILSTTENIAD